MPTSAAPARRSSLRSPWFLGALALAAAWWTLDLAVLRAGVPHPSDDHWEDLLIAERLLAGDGFRTPMIYPPLWSLRDAADTVPVLVHGPLLPLLTVPALALLGPGALDSTALPAALAAMLALVPIYRLGARTFGPAAGAAAAGLFTLSPVTLGAVHHSGSVVAGAALAAFVLDLLLRPVPRALAAGAVAGLAYLVRPEMLVAFPVLAALAWRPGGANGRAIGALLLGFLLFAAPWWAHHARAVGSPFFNLTSYTLVGFWGARPDVSVMQDFALPPSRWPEVMRAELPGMTAKWIAFFPRAVKHLLSFPSGGTGWLVAAGVIAAVWRPRRFGPDVAATRRLAIAALLLSALPLASMTLTVPQPLYVMTFAALFAVAAAAGASVVVDALPVWARRPRAWTGALALVMALAALPALRAAAEEARMLERRIRMERTALGHAFPRHAPGPRVIFSDTPDFAAWVTGRPAIWTTREAFDRLYAAHDPAAPRFGLPPRDSVAGWFHRDFRDPRSPGELVWP